MSREVYGRVYEPITSRPEVHGRHPYVGQTRQTVHQRVHGRGGHTSALSVAKDPWKADILPGRAGYRVLKTIYATGDPGADQVRLDMAEAFAIDELNPTHNTQRPIRPAPEPRPPRPPSRRELAELSRRQRTRARLVCLLVVVAIFTVLAARVTSGMQVSPSFPWFASPALGVALGWPTFWWLHQQVRRLARGSRR